jgi:hypothetical protein
MFKIFLMWNFYLLCLFFLYFNYLFENNFVRMKLKLALVINKVNKRKRAFVLFFLKTVKNLRFIYHHPEYFNLFEIKDLLFIYCLFVTISVVQKTRD